MKPITNSQQKNRCSQCNKTFNSQVELRIHEKVKHQAAFQDNNQNINSSDLSDDEERQICVFRGQAIKQQEIINKLSIQVSQANNNKNNDKNLHGANKPIVSAKFQSPIIISDQEKKVYLCGCEQKIFDSAANLSLHIKKQHNGFPPQGTLYGVCRQLVRRQFQPTQQKTQVIRPQIEKTDFVCGCGLSYVRVSSLRHHIRHNHSGQPPFGTIGLTKVVPYGQNTQGEQSGRSRLSFDAVQLSRCKNCFQLCKQTKYSCDSCPEWKICKSCTQHQQILRQHQQKGHRIGLFD